MAAIRLLIVDDHVLFRDGLRAVLERHPDFLVVGEAGDASTAIRLAGETTPDLILMDLDLPHDNGVEAARTILAQQPGVKIIALTMHRDDNLILDTIRMGMRGYMLKDTHATDLMQGIRAVIAGGAALDPIVAARILELFQHALAREAGAAREEFFAREIEILCQLAAGENNRQIAGRLALSEQTVKNLLSGLYEKLNVNNRTEAVIVALRRGLIKPQG